MIISEEGIRLIKSFEGYGRKLANGDCTAYQTRLKNGKLDIPTIGYGCTEGVRMGDVWAKEKADAQLMTEINKHVEAVNRLITVEVNQNEADACYSLSYNIGTGIGSKKKGFANSKVLKNLNAGNRQAAADAFDSYVYAQGSKEGGLVSRRARERALFLKPAVQPDEPYMPQTVDAPKLQPPSATVAATGTAATGGFLYTAWQAIGDKFNSFFDGLDQEQAMMLFGTAKKHGIGDQLWALPTQHPAFLAALAAGGLVLFLRIRAAS